MFSAKHYLGALREWAGISVDERHELQTKVTDSGLGRRRLFRYGNFPHVCACLREKWRKKLSL